MLDKLISLIKKLFCKLNLRACEKPCSGCPKPKKEQPKKEETEQPKKEQPKKKADKQEHVEPDRKEPDFSDFENIKIQSILWKPASDHAPHDPVVLVGCDALRSEDVYLEILNSSGNKLLIDIDNTKRANILHPQKYGRVHFRIRRSAKKFKKASPIKLVVSTEINGKKKVLKTLRVKDTTKRVDKKY